MRCALAKVAIAIGLCTTLGCLDTMEPTTVSQYVSIESLNASGVELALTNVVTATIRIRNTGTQQVFIDTGYRRLEKLVDQRWEVANESVSPGNVFRANNPGLGTNRVSTVSYSAVYDRSKGDTALLAHVRGVYRLGFRMAFAPDGSNMIALEETYSKPFAVVCC